MPYLVNINTLSSLAVLPRLINDVGNSSDMSASAALFESCGKGSMVTYLLFHALSFATPNFLAETRNIGCPNFLLSFLLR